MPSSPSSAEASVLDRPLQFLKGVGPSRAEKFKKLGIATLGDLLRHFPRRHEDRRHTASAREARPGTAQTFQGRVERFEVARAGRHLAIGKALLNDGSGAIWAVWFRRLSFRYDVFAPLSRQLAPGTEVLVHGGVKRTSQGLQVRVDEHEIRRPGSPETVHTGRLVPLHDLTEGLDGRWMRERVWEALGHGLSDVRENLPEDFIERHRLAPLPWCLQQIHFPDSWENLALARRRLAFEEFFFFELALARAREQDADGPPAVSCRPTRALLTPFRAGLGFDFTPAQKKVINEIFVDMAQEKPMSRLLQGDVGSGKTVVALSALLLAVENKLQAVLMAPTEILAEQHFLTVQKFLKGLPVRAALLTGRVPKKERDRLARDLKTGEVAIALGTHALLEDPVEFQRLGLVVIDEQHRFGVRQRARLQGKASAPHTLIMTATPIPRTLAMTLYGDLSVSTIQSLPPGRPALATHWTLEANALAAVRRAVSAGRQAYIVFPLVEESDKLDLRAAVKEHDRLARTVFPGFRVGLLHGRMKGEEKEKAMAGFASGATQILVATPVVEVGIDVPNATVMVVMHAERFGLSQLHQLRGRLTLWRGKLTIPE